MNVMAGVPTVFLASETKLNSKDIKEKSYWVPDAHGVAIPILDIYLRVDFRYMKKNKTKPLHI